MEKPAVLQSRGLQRIRHELAATKMYQKWSSEIFLSDCSDILFLDMGRVEKGEK